jgi:hypothetical protein
MLPQVMIVLDLAILSLFFGAVCLVERPGASAACTAA